ncbi:MAG: hypothetical protein LBI16_03045 [Burkholderiales bacterium]|nr:hypothetical protein [Burkholderiales bacterium]
MRFPKRYGAPFPAQVTSLSGFPGYGAPDIIIATITIYPIAIGQDDVHPRRYNSGCEAGNG